MPFTATCAAPTSRQASMFIYFVVLAGSAAPAWCKGFLVEKGELHGVDTKLFESEVEGAMGAMLGCGAAVDKDRLATIEEELKPMWRVLPKNGQGRLERRTLRYLAHRYFMQKSSLLIRGFEPSRPVNHSHWGAADILSQQVPAFVESQLESQRAQDRGFSLEDAAMMIVTLDQLIFDSESAVLEKAYAAVSAPTTGSLDSRRLGKVLESYMVNWMLGDDPEGIQILLSNQSLLESSFPHWQGLVSFAHGQISHLDFLRRRPSLFPPATNTGAVSPSKARRWKDALSSRYTFDDAHQVVGGITRSFASFWESECVTMKQQLVEMDKYGTGRVPLSKFYGSALDTDWRFGESESYLRELGALDESSRWMGKQVIIPNYMQAASNCIVSTPHYLVCCVNDCEALLGEIEETIGTPSASPEAILAIVGNMTSQTTVDHDDPPVLKGSLTTQLEEIGRKNYDSVPLHGRLFAQWLHYVFPRECPFPHKMGVASTATPSEFGDSYLAKNEDMQVHASSEQPHGMPEGANEWMSQWSPDEELVVDYSGEMRAPWEGQSRGYLFFGFLVLLALGVLAGGVGLAGSGKKPMSNDNVWTKAHFV